MAVGLLAGIVIARTLGPSGKGTFATLAFLVDLAAGCAALGLGEVAVVRIARDHLSSQSVLSWNVTIAMGTSALVSAGFLFITPIFIHAPSIRFAASAGAVTVACVALTTVLGGILLARGRVFEASLATTVGPVVTAASIWLLVAVAHQGVFGGMAAGAIGSAGCLVLFATMVERMGLSIRPRLAGLPLRQNLVFGGKIQLAILLQSLAARLDLLLVFGMMGGAAAGQYSIALTFAVVIAAVPRAVSYATFPRLSSRSVDEAHELLVRTTRVGTAGAALAALIIGISAPTIVPLLFGSQFKAAVLPSLIILAGGVLMGLQWSIAQGRVAHGDATTRVASYTVSTLGMLLSDLVLIPPYGIAGAAVAAVLGPALGCIVCLVPGRRARRVRLREIAPRFSDVRFLFKQLARVRRSQASRRRN